MFKALLDAPMREGKEGVVDIQDVRAPVFRTLLHFLYTDSLPEVGPGGNAWACIILCLRRHYMIKDSVSLCKRRS